MFQGSGSQSGVPGNLLEMQILRLHPRPTDLETLEEGPRSLFFFCCLVFRFNLFIFGCVGSSFLREGFLQLRRAGATLHRGARASHYRGLSRCRAQAPDAQAQQLWLTVLVAPRHVGSSQTRARTRVPCIGRQTLNHCATREAPQQSVLTNSPGDSDPGLSLRAPAFKPPLELFKVISVISCDLSSEVEKNLNRMENYSEKFQNYQSRNVKAYLTSTF